MSVNNFPAGRLFELTGIVAQQAAYIDMLASRIATIRRSGEELHHSEIDSVLRATRHLEGAADTLKRAAWPTAEVTTLQAAE
jgi:hypothetical protein